MRPRPRPRARPAAGLALDLATDAAEAEASSRAVGLYVHIPYCRRRCRYCDFAIVPVGTAAAAAAAGGGRNGEGFVRMDEAYRDAVLAEVDLIGRARRAAGEGEGDARLPLRSVYFGGGTPSLAPAETLTAILGSVLAPPGGDGPFFVPPGGSDGEGGDLEVTIEMDPGTFDLPMLLDLREAGFNRLSLGVQSFDDGILEGIGRTHRRADVMESIGLIRRAFGGEKEGGGGGGGSNYSIDLISGLPGQTVAGWADALETATCLDPRPDHLSLYDLQVEEGTVFGRWYGGDGDGDDDDDDDDGRPGGGRGTDPIARTRAAPEVTASSASALHPLPSPEDCAGMYRYASGYLRAKGYGHYEISSYARPGRRSRHNQIYWEVGSEWYSVGLGGTSCVGGRRFARPREMADYLEWVAKQKAVVDGGGVPDWMPGGGEGEGEDEDEGEAGGGRVTPPLPHDDPDLLTDVIMTRLRTAEGLDLAWLRDSVTDGHAKVGAVLRGADLALGMGLAEHDAGTDHLRLVDPDGFLFSNSIISQIFVELDM